MRWILLLVLVMAGCDLGTGPTVEYLNRRPMEPVPAVYAELYASTSDCLVEHGYRVRPALWSIRWFVADEIRLDGGRKAGVLDFPNGITMWERAAALPWAVRHEMSHHLTGTGDALHDAYGRVPCES